MFLKLAISLSLCGFVAAQSPPQPKIITISKNPDNSCGIALSSNYVPPDFTQKNCFLTHGYLGTPDTIQFWTMANNYETSNICTAYYVTWESLATTLNNPQTTFVGSCLAKFLFPSINQVDKTQCDTHFVGHSLGAHVMGAVGNTLQTLGYTPPRITGLDPAKAAYFIVGAYGQHLLSSTDAKMVIHVHTNDCEAGTIAKLGTLNIMVNNACLQPGCSLIDLTLPNPSVSCSHNRSVLIQNESIISNGFVASSCLPPFSCDKIVYTNNVQASGTYYLPTNAQSPYAMDAPQLSVYYNYNLN